MPFVHTLYPTWIHHTSFSTNETTSQEYIQGEKQIAFPTSFTIPKM